MVIRNYAHHLTSVYNNQYNEGIELKESTGQLYLLPVSLPDPNKVTVNCPRCQSSVIAIRFRTHLMKCAGDGRKCNKYVDQIWEYFNINNQISGKLRKKSANKMLGWRW